METNLINKVVMTTLLLAALCFAVLSLMNELVVSLGILAGAGWGCTNLILIKYLIQNWLTIGCRNYCKRYILIGVKFPLLYVIGFALLKSHYFSIQGFVIGFSLLSLAIALRGLKMALSVKIS